MAVAVVGHMKKMDVKTVGFLGYTDAYGEGWLKDSTAEAEKNGIKIVASGTGRRPTIGATPARPV